MQTQIVNDGACIRIINDGTPLLIVKTQIKTIDTVKNMVRIDIGEGALRNIYIDQAVVTEPDGLGDANDLRDAIKAMLDGSAGDFSSLVGLGQSQVDILAAVRNGLDQLTQKTISSGQAQVQTVSTVKDAITAASDLQGQKLTDIKAGFDTLAQGQTKSFGDMLTVLGQIRDGVAVTGSNFKDPLRIDESVPMVVYNGFAVATSGSPAAGPLATDPIWAIQKISRNGDVYTYEWANGSKQFNNIWNNRYNLPYASIAG